MFYLTNFVDHSATEFSSKKEAFEYAKILSAVTFEYNSSDECWFCHDEMDNLVCEISIL